MTDMGYLPIGVHYSRSDTPQTIEDIAMAVGYHPTQLALKTLMLKTLCTLIIRQWKYKFVYIWKLPCYSLVFMMWEATSRKQKH